MCREIIIILTSPAIDSNFQWLKCLRFERKKNKGKNLWKKSHQHTCWLIVPWIRRLLLSWFHRWLHVPSDCDSFGTNYQITYCNTIQDVSSTGLDSGLKEAMKCTMWAVESLFQSNIMFWTLSISSCFIVIITMTLLSSTKPSSVEQLVLTSINKWGKL